MACVYSADAGGQARRRAGGHRRQTTDEIQRTDPTVRAVKRSEQRRGGGFSDIYIVVWVAVKVKTRIRHQVFVLVFVDRELQVLGNVIREHLPCSQLFRKPNCGGAGGRHGWVAECQVWRVHSIAVCT